jgi:hypothetical protein
MRQTLKPTDDWRVAWEARRDAQKRKARQWRQERLRDPEAADRRLAEKHDRIAERDRLIVAKWLAEHPTYGGARPGVWHCANTGVADHRQGGPDCLDGSTSGGTIEVEACAGARLPLVRRPQPFRPGYIPPERLR